MAAAIAGSGLLIVATGAEARDGDRWRDKEWRRWEHRHHHDHWRHGPPRRVFVERERVYERQPIFVTPAPVMMAPMSPYYSQPVDPSVNLNFIIPLR
jgi:hypothetical protein